MKSFAGFAGFLGHTPIDWSLALSLSAAAVVGSLLGGAWVARVHPAHLRQGFGWFVVAMAFFILLQEIPRLVGAEPSLALAVLASVLGPSLLYGVKRLLSQRALTRESLSRLIPETVPPSRHVEGAESPRL
jgi:hypothetical protein